MIWKKACNYYLLNIWLRIEWKSTYLWRCLPFFQDSPSWYLYACACCLIVKLISKYQPSCCCYSAYYFALSLSSELYYYCFVCSVTRIWSRLFGHDFGPKSRQIHRSNHFLTLIFLSCAIKTAAHLESGLHCGKSLHFVSALMVNLDYCCCSYSCCSS